MALKNNPYYQELCQQMNPYLAVMEMAEDARTICHYLDNRITVATALEYASQGKMPNPKDFPDHRLDRVREYLTYVNDIEIRSAVIKSYEYSLKQNDLIYDYNNVDDEPRQARVRIIMNILWDKRPHKTT